MARQTLRRPPQFVLPFHAVMLQSMVDNMTGENSGYERTGLRNP